MHLVSNRAQDRLRQYWDFLRDERRFPSESQFDPDAVVEIWPSCFLISIDDVTHRLGYRYSYLGKDLIEAYGDDISSPEIAARLLSTANITTTRHFDEVVETRAPVMDQAEFVNLRKRNIKYRTCLLPLGYNDNEVSHIIGCMSWRVY